MGPNLLSADGQAWTDLFTVYLWAPFVGAMLASVIFNRLIDFNVEVMVKAEDDHDHHSHHDDEEIVG